MKDLPKKGPWAETLAKDPQDGAGNREGVPRHWRRSVCGFLLPWSRGGWRVFNVSTVLLELAGLGLLVSMLAGVRGSRCWFGAVVTSALCALSAAIHTLVCGGVWAWRCPLAVGGQGVHLQRDALSALFLALLSLIGGVGVLYAWQYWDDEEHPRSAPAGRVWWCVLLLGLGLVLLGRNGLHFRMA